MAAPAKPPGPTEQDPWAVPYIRARIKLLESNDLDDAVYATEEAATRTTIQTMSISASVKTDLELELCMLAMKKTASKLRALIAKEDVQRTLADEQIVHAVVRGVAACDTVLSGVDCDNLTKTRKPGPDVDGVYLNPSESEKFKTRESRAIEALLVKGHALLDLEAFAPDNGDSASLHTSIDLLSILLDIKDHKFVQLKLRLARKDSRFGTALMLVDQLLNLEDSVLSGLPDPTSWLSLCKIKLAILEQLEWSHIAARLKESLARVAS